MAINKEIFRSDNKKTEVKFCIRKQKFGIPVLLYVVQKSDDQQTDRPAVHSEERNKSDLNSSELKSILLSNGEDNSTLRFERKQSRPVPRLHALLQPEIISSTVLPDQQDMENGITVNDVRKK